MNARFLIHSILILTLCLGQLAANVHIIGDMQAAANPNQVPQMLSVEHDGHQHRVLSLTASDAAIDADAELECGIYHAHAGLAGFAVSDCKLISLQSSPLANSKFAQRNHFVHIVERQPIRGPPVNS